MHLGETCCGTNKRTRHIFTSCVRILFVRNHVAKLRIVYYKEVIRASWRLCCVVKRFLTSKAAEQYTLSRSVFVIGHAFPCVIKLARNHCRCVRTSFHARKVQHLRNERPREHCAPHNWRQHLDRERRTASWGQLLRVGYVFRLLWWHRFSEFKDTLPCKYPTDVTCKYK